MAATTSASSSTCRRRGVVDIISIVTCIAGVLLTTCVLCVRGRIVDPNTNELYLRSGDRLHLVCEQRVTQTTVQKDVVWSKLEIRRGVSVDPDNEENYQTITTSLLDVEDAPYTINQRPTDDEGGDLLRSELVKNNVARADSGYYRCRLGLGGEFSRILVTVIDMSVTEPVSERVNSKVQLTCTVTDHEGWTNYSVSWYRHGNQIYGGGSKYQLEDTASGGVLTVRRVKESDVGQYQCAVTLGTGPARKTLKHVVNLFSYPHVRSFDRSESVVAGRSLVLDCRAWGWLAPNVSWYRGQQELTPFTDSRVSLSSAPGRPPGSRLTINGIEQNDRAYYTCVAWSDDWGGVLRQRNATVLVRVKGRLAALWPLLGLGVEVIILCVIIVAYEMKRNKRLLLDEDANDPTTDDNCAKAKMAANSNSATTTPDRTRHRKDVDTK